MHVIIIIIDRDKYGNKSSNEYSPSLSLFPLSRPLTHTRQQHIPTRLQYQERRQLTFWRVPQWVVVVQGSLSEEDQELASSSKCTLSMPPRT